jgi:uncharacterized Zn-binding protein involved in type VI secretion
VSGWLQKCRGRNSAILDHSGREEVETMLAARITDLHVCPAFGGPIVLGMLVGGLPPARLLDNTTTGGVIIAPSAPTVLIGG